MRQIDLNADLGELEDASLDAAVMPFISSASIACGGHAGNPETIRRTIRLALQYGVAIGAHPGYPDPENFGRRSLDIPVAELCSLVAEQLKQFKIIADEEGATIRHIKLHGALYNDLTDDYERSLEVSKTIASIDRGLRFIIFSNSAAARAAEDAGLVAIHEVFADRAYAENGKLVPRSEPGAVLDDEEACLAQVERFIKGDSGLPADSICVHGDNPSAVQFVYRLRNYFESRKVGIQPAGELTFTYARLGERSLLAQLPARIAKSTHRKIRALQLALEGTEGVLEMVPCYAELKIDFDPMVTSFSQLRNRIASLELSPADLPMPRLVEVPVFYKGADLAVVAEHNELTIEEVIRLHSERTYLVYMLGFSPGFPYMGGLNPKLATPRLETPRISIPAGSVGIAGNQTGIYPVESPGGWNIIGHTPLKLFEPSAENPFLFDPGDEVRFMPVLEGEEIDSQGAIMSEPCIRKSSDRASPSSKSVNIIEPGMYTTVQDRGRFGFLRYGLPPSGTMDHKAMGAANELLGNDLGAAVLECTGTMPVLEFSKAVRIAVVYADHHEVLEVSVRSSFEPIKVGYRAYIAIEGGFDVPFVMGSRSTFVPGTLGGFEGRPLKARDVLHLGDGAGWKPAIQRAVLQTSSLPCPAVRVIPGPEADWFDCGGLNTFLTEAFSVSSKSDRTGIRLNGAPLSFRSGEQMVSSGIAMGTIQVPPSGHPIIMMADHPTTGGYPRIGNVVEDDLSILAQLRPGEEIRFCEVSTKLLK